MTNEQRRERRARIAKAIKSGKSIADVCRRFQAGILTVRAACVENGVEFSTRKKVKGE